MTKEEKLEIYRRFFISFDEWLRDGYVEVSSCRVLFGIQLSRLIKDAKAAEKGEELPDLGIGIRLTDSEKIDLQNNLKQPIDFDVVT